MTARSSGWWRRRINLSLADGHPELRTRVGDACSEVEEALAELREIAHGLYPQALSR